MRTNNALHNGQESTWQLLLQFASADGPAGERESAQRVAEAVRELGLPPSQMERIGKAVMEALRKATRRGHPDQPDRPVTVRVWISDGCTEERSHSGANGRECGRQAGRGWGFFMIQKQEENPQPGAGEAHRLVELFLYQEGEHA